MKSLICCVPGCAARVHVPVRLGWTAATCAFGHACWIVRAVGKTVILRRNDASGAGAAPPSLGPTL